MVRVRQSLLCDLILCVEVSKSETYNREILIVSAGLPTIEAVTYTEVWATMLLLSEDPLSLMCIVGRIRRMLSATVNELGVAGLVGW